MAKRIRKPPSVSENKDPRAREYWERDLEEFGKMVGTATVDLGSLNSGVTAVFTIAVPGCKPDMQQTVQVAPPTNWNTNLVMTTAYVTADDTVTVVVWNPTGGAINPPSGLWGARVMP